MSTGFKSKKEYVYDLLRSEIVKGKHLPGSRLVIDEMAIRLNVSQIPIREAIQQLEADGFVTTEPHVGARVAQIDATFIFEVFALLESMEIICSRTACTLMTDEELATFSQMIADMDQSLEDAETWSEQNKAMHLFICTCAKTMLVLKMMQKVFDHWDRLRLYYLKDIGVERIQTAQAEHKLLLGAFQQRDPDAVEQIIRAHNQSALQSYTQHLQSEGHLLVGVN
jgi:DNA-binding GntR family transcriptional regulator